MTDVKLHRVEITFVGYVYGKNESDAIDEYLSEGVREDPPHMAYATEVTKDTKGIEPIWHDCIPWGNPKNDESKILDIWRAMRE